jgi:hypothetical protein
MTYLPELKSSLVKAARRAYVDAPQRGPHRARRRLIGGGLATALAAAVAVAVAVVAVVALSHRPARTGVAASRPLTRTDLQRSAAQALEMLKLPSGAVRSGLVHGTPAQLRSPSARLGIPNGVDVYRVWRLPETPDRVIQFLERHFPGNSATAFGSEAGTGREAGSGRAGGPVVIQEASGSIILRGTRNGVWRQLALNAARLSGGGTVLRVDSEAGWLKPRPATELIPAGVTRIVFSWGIRRLRRHGSVTITNPVRVKALVSALNSLPAGRGLCKSAPNGFLRFEFDGGNGKQPLAVATWAVRCRNLGLTINGRPTVPLMASPGESFGAPFYAQLADVLVKVDRPRRVERSVTITTVHSSGSCVVTYGPPNPAKSPSAHGAAGGSCASVSRSTTSASGP